MRVAKAAAECHARVPRGAVSILRFVASRWPFVGRAHELARIGTLLSAGEGALILGPAGVGKTALARQAAQQFSGGAAFGRVVGHTVSNGIPYEAFAGVLPAGDTSLLNPADVAKRVGATLGHSAGARALFVVDDAQLLDERSAQVLLQLAADGTAAVLATARDLELPDAMGRLWRDGLCEQIEIGGLTDTDATELIETALGGPVEPAAARTFVQRSEGNPLLLRELVGAALDASILVWRGTAWALSGRAPLSRGIRELVSFRIAGLPDAQRAALEMIAAGEPLAIGVAVELVGEPILDELDADRLITVRTGLAGPEVTTAHPLHGELLRADIPALRLRRLRLALASRLEAADRPSSHDLVRAALWRLESGQADEPERVLAAARAAQSLSLETAERLARHAHETTASLQASVLLAEILVHLGRSAEAARITQALPPDSLTPADREALVYCAAMSEGLLTGDAGGGAEIVGGLLAGDAAASDQLRGLHCALLAFDARFGQALEVGTPLLDDPAAHAAARTFAGLGVIGSEYWLGRTRRAVTLADSILPLALSVREVLPFGAASIELIAVCALVEEGQFDRAEARAQQMRQQAADDDDPFTRPRAEYCHGRVELMRGRPATALRDFRRCLAALSSFDQAFLRHISSMLARAAALTGDVATARATLDACADAPRMKTYEPEFELAVAATDAAEMRLAEAADHAAWAAEVAADHSEWNVALAGYHDAARYGAARQILIPMREAATHVDGTLAWCYLDHASALARRDPVGLDEAARRFESHGAILLAAEAAAEAALAHTAAGHARLARASANRASALRNRCETTVLPWLAGAAVPVALTARERQIAVLAARGETDAAIADQLAISARTVQTHLARVYSKLGITGRSEIADQLADAQSVEGAR
jgi:DNA-binding CsgD family transcriptional regulator